MQALRAKHLAARDLDRLEQLKLAFRSEHGYFSLQNELRVHLQLAASLEDLLVSYSSKLKDDKALWQTELNRFLSLAKLGAVGGLAPSALRSSAYSPSSAFLSPPNYLASIAYRQALKRVLHSLVLSSLGSVRELFASLSDRWHAEFDQQWGDMLALEKEEAAEKAAAAAAGTPAPAPAVDAEGKADDAAAWHERLSKWKNDLAEWRREAVAWEDKWNKWQAWVGGDDITVPAPVDVASPGGGPPF